MSNIKKFEMNETAIQKLEAAAPALVVNIVKKLSPKFMALAEEVLSMSTEVNPYVDSYECVSFKGNQDPESYGYSEVTFLVDVEDGEVVPFDRMSINSRIRDIFFRVEINLRDPSRGVSLEELVGYKVDSRITDLAVLNRFHTVLDFISENRDLIADRIESGELDPEKLGLVSGGRKRVTIKDASELVPAVAQFYFEGGNGAVRMEDFFDGGWCLSGIVAVLDIFFYGKQVHG